MTALKNAKRSFIRGAVSVFDVTGRFVCPASPTTPRPSRADAAIALDWMKVGGDIHSGMNRAVSESNGEGEKK